MNIARVFFGISMGYVFQGLTGVLKTAKVKCSEDTTLLFINKRMTAFKMLRGKDFLVYYKTNTARRIPLDALRYLPQQFGGTELEMDAAIKKSLQSKLGYE